MTTQHHMHHEYDDQRHMAKEHCERYRDHAVQMATKDGHTYQAIIIDVDFNNVTILVPEDFDEHHSDMRQYGYGYGYGYRPRRFRRYRRLVLPLAALTALSLLPIAAYPYYPYY